MDTRKRILDAALACFTEFGYEQTTIARICERSGVSNGALFHHFPTKEAIAGALYVDAIASFQQGLWSLLRRRPRSLHAAVRGSITHQLQWIERNQDSARFLYARGHLDWDGPAGAQLQELNRDLAHAYRDWMAPLLDCGQIRPMSMLMINAIVAGPVHAIARRWLAGQLRSPLHAYRDELADAACAALSGAPASARRHPRSLVRQGRIRLELVSDDGSVLAGGEATAELLPVPAPARPATMRAAAARSGTAA
jgi:AcrR family transcriptional regulator